MNHAEERRRAEIERIEAALDAVPWPPFVTGREWTRDTDSTGDEAIWIWIVVPTYEVMEANASAWTPLTEEIREALRRRGVEYWPYFRLKAENEQAA